MLDATKTLENYEATTEVQQKAVAALRRWLTERIPGIFVLYGPPGRGKTHLAHAAVNHRHEKGFYLHPRVAHYSMAGSLPYATHTGLIVLDDLYYDREVKDMHPGTEFKQLNEVVIDAYARRRQVIITTNHDAPALFAAAATHDTTGRVKSRLDEILFTFPLDGEDWRARLGAKTRALLG